MRVLVLGGGGLLGHKLVQVFGSRFEVGATFHASFEKFRRVSAFDGARIFEQVDAENIGSLALALKTARPDVIVNAIGVTKHVSDVGNAIKTITINSLFPHQVAQLAGECDARLISISTDCVFSGAKGNYVEEDVPDATDLYGRSKSLGEVVDGNCLTIRTSIIGRELFTRNSLVEWFLNSGGRRVKGFTKAIFTGFPTVILAEIIADIIESRPDLTGLYHISSEPVSKFDLLQLIKDEMKVGVEIDADSEFEIDRSLDSTKFRLGTGFAPKPWPQMIKEMADDAGMYKTL